MIEVRAEQPDDHEAVRQVITAAFDQPDEAKLVDALRKSADPAISLVAVENGAVVGHIFFSPVTVESESDSWTAMGLAPMAVLPDYQRQGIGSALARRGLEECQRLDEPVVFVLGHPKYYPRFGFTPAPPVGLTCEYPVPDEVFMVAELEAGAIDGRTGLVRYMPEFADL